MSFPDNAPSAAPVFYRTYSRRTASGREEWSDVVKRTVDGLQDVGKLTDEEANLIREQMLQCKAMPSGRWLWVGGTEWVTQKENFSGAYNCTSTDLEDLEAFADQMALLMMGSGTGAVIEEHTYKKLPIIRNGYELEVVGEFGSEPSWPLMEIQGLNEPEVQIQVGDSRQGWCDTLLWMLRLACYGTVEKVRIDLSAVRSPGSPIAGFGGTANPIRLKETYERVGAILKGAAGRQLTSVECCLILDECSLAVVAGNVRRSAGMRQFAYDDAEAAVAKDNLWQQDEDGKWRIDPKRDALRMANHTRVLHRRPTLEEVKESVTKQFHSGEGAIQFAPEAIARANRDVLGDYRAKDEFINQYLCSPEIGRSYMAQCGGDDLDHRMARYGLNPCGEIIGKDFHCNLAEVHLNLLEPNDIYQQADAFRAAALAAASLLHHEFAVPRYQKSRELDPIIGVSFTGLFDFFVLKFGEPWLRWWSEGRPRDNFFYPIEQHHLRYWKQVVEDTVQEYCKRHNLKCPNRTTTVQPAGTKSLLTGASPGWHPPKAARFIRRITFAKNDPVALACLSYGYNVVPSQSSRDEDGRLLDDPFDPRVTEWLVEIPTKTPWADIPGCDQYDISQFSALAQFDFYMQVQRNYTLHNTSATIEFRENEIDELSKAIFDACGYGYVSAALLARFDSNETFPRLPFEPIDRETYERLINQVLQYRSVPEFSEAMKMFVDVGAGNTSGPAACDSDKCLFAEKKPQ